MEAGKGEFQKLFSEENTSNESIIKAITDLDSRFAESFSELDKYFNLSIIGGEFYEEKISLEQIKTTLQEINQLIFFYNHISKLAYDEIFETWSGKTEHVVRLVRDYSTLIEYTRSNILERSNKELDAKYEKLFDIHEIERLIQETEKEPVQHDISYPLFRLNIYLFKIDDGLSCSDDVLKKVIKVREMISNTTRSVVGDILNDKCVYLMKKVELRRFKSPRPSSSNGWKLANGELIKDLKIEFFKSFDADTTKHYFNYEPFLADEQKVQEIKNSIFQADGINLINLHFATKLLKKKNDLKALQDLFEKYKTYYTRQINVNAFDRMAFISAYLLVQNALFVSKFVTLINEIEASPALFSKNKFQNSLNDIIKYYYDCISQFDINFKRLNFKLSYDGLKYLDKLFKIEEFKFEEYVDEDLLKEIVQFTGDLRRNAKDHLQIEKRSGDLPFYLTLKNSIAHYAIPEGQDSTNL